MRIEDDEPNGRPDSCVSLKKVLKIILDERKMKLTEIADTLKITRENLDCMVHKILVCESTHSIS